MGKLFPLITNLKAHPEYLAKTIALIEKSFDYKQPHSFIEDFAPLVDESNHHNCFILVNENEEVIAHVGVKEKTLKLNDVVIPFCLMGGIAVDELHRGEGNFQNLFQDALAEKRSDVAFFLLWTNQEKLYKKFGFHLCGSQFEVSAPKLAKPQLTQTKYHLLDENEKKEIRMLYQTSFQHLYYAPERTQEDWKLIEKIKSADLYLEINDHGIQSYCFMNKGQDLTGIIYEYGSHDDIVSWLEQIQSLGKLWLGKELLETQQDQYQYMMAPGDTNEFTKLISTLTEGKVVIQGLNIMKQEIYFEFNDEVLGMDVEEFLRGIFGPGSFEELSDIKPLFLSGLDSV